MRFTKSIADAAVQAMRMAGVRNAEPPEIREPQGRDIPISERQVRHRNGKVVTITRVIDRRWIKPNEHEGWRNGLGTNLMKRHLRAKAAAR